MGSREGGGSGRDLEKFKGEERKDMISRDREE